MSQIKQLVGRTHTCTAQQMFPYEMFVTVTLSVSLLHPLTLWPSHIWAMEKHSCGKVFETVQGPVVPLLCLEIQRPYSCDILHCFLWQISEWKQNQIWLLLFQCVQYVACLKAENYLWLCKSPEKRFESLWVKLDSHSLASFFPPS